MNKDEAPEIKQPSARWYGFVAIVLFVASASITLVVFMDEYAEYLKTRPPQTAAAVFESRYDFAVRSPSGACPYATTPYNETACFKLKSVNGS